MLTDTQDLLPDSDPGSDPDRDTDSDTDHAPPVAGRWEPCCTFRATAGTTVCEHCGWLEDEHDLGAEVRALPVRRAAARPRRLAS